MTKPISIILDEAADLLEQPGAWTQNWTARDEDGEVTTALEDDAVCWCAAGAIIKANGAYNDLAKGAIGFVEQRLLHNRIDRWNDHPSRTQSEVVSALRTAAKQAGEAV